MSSEVRTFGEFDQQRENKNSSESNKYSMFSTLSHLEEGGIDERLDKEVVMCEFLLLVSLFDGEFTARWVIMVSVMVIAIKE